MNDRYNLINERKKLKNKIGKEDSDESVQIVGDNENCLVNKKLANTAGKIAEELVPLPKHTVQKFELK